MSKERKPKPVGIWDHTNAMGCSFACMLVTPFVIGFCVFIAQSIHTSLGAWAWIMLPVTIVAVPTVWVWIFVHDSTWTREEAAKRGCESDWDIGDCGYQGHRDHSCNTHGLTGETKMKERYFALTIHDSLFSLRECEDELEAIDAAIEDFVDEWVAVFSEEDVTKWHKNADIMDAVYNGMTDGQKQHMANRLYKEDGISAQQV